MSLDTKRIIIAVLGGVFLLSLLFVQWMEVARKQEEAGLRAREALDSVGIPEELHDEFPLHLSGGQRRRVALAGVLAMQPRMLLLDEPSSDLDPRGRRELIALLNGLDITKIISSHNLDFVAKTCDRALVLDAGKLVADGPVQEVLRDEALMLDHGLEVPPSLGRA